MGHLGVTFTSAICPGYPCREEVWKAGLVAKYSCESAVQAERDLNVNTYSWSIRYTRFPHDPKPYPHYLPAAFLLLWSTSSCSAAF